MLGITDRDYHHQLTSNPQDVCEDVIRYFFSIPNGINPLLNAFPAKFPDGSGCLTVALSFRGIPILQKVDLKGRELFCVSVKLI